MELREQVQVQVFLSVMRIVLLFAMLGTTLPTIEAADDSDLRPFVDSETGETVTSGGGVPVWHMDHIHQILTIGAYAFIFHHSMPALSHPVQDKKQLSNIFTATLSFCMVAYCLLGTVLACYFGSNLYQSANLNWNAYVHINQDGYASHTLGSELVGSFVVLFPAMDVASAFPLNAITLGNSLMSSYYSADEYRELSKNRYKVAVFRVIAAAPPIVCAAISGNLGSLTAWSGLAGLLIMIMFPPVLCYASKKVFLAAGLNPLTYYSTVLTSDFGATTLFVLGTIVSLYCAISLATEHNTQDKE
jgi:hypothetical protein